MMVALDLSGWGLLFHWKEKLVPLLAVIGWGGMYRAIPLTANVLVAVSTWPYRAILLNLWVASLWRSHVRYSVCQIFPLRFLTANLQL